MNVILVVLKNVFLVFVEYLQLSSSDLQPAAHVQKVRRSLLVQHDVDGNAALGRLKQIPQNLQIGQQVHHDSHDLDNTQTDGSFTLSSSI